MRLAELHQCVGGEQVVVLFLDNTSSHFVYVIPYFCKLFKYARVDGSSSLMVFYHSGYRIRQSGIPLVPLVPANVFQRIPGLWVYIYDTVEEVFSFR